MNGERIGYRAWDREFKKMFSSDSQGMVYFWERIDGDYDGFDIMRYTGLKDKDGTKIYEGDIVRYQGMVGEIKYVDNRFMPWAYYEREGEYDWDEETLWWGGTSKIIGNIHENAKLLPKEQNEKI